MRPSVWGAPKGTTSTGTAPVQPRRGTSLDSSTMTTKRSPAPSIIFSRSSEPPRPLTRLRSGSTSSAPSMERWILPAPASGRSGIPARVAWASVLREVGTPATPGSAAARRRSPRRSSACAAVEPVPRPSVMPGSTNSTARCAATRFSSSCVSFPDGGGEAAALPMAGMGNV
ncbi:hypothetical protein U9M48_032835 [Paspalum notatum var. saurae]|uniref:Uncharacterized protein n=1 Tax=Paspalum notatum var. saurae TaxID=547442 RepID=A0AAQ3UA37_PASNO